jgi:hypothetical protein
MKQTAVEWYFKQMQSKEQFTQEEFDSITNQAKEMENQQKDKFAIDFYNWICSELAVYLIQDLQIVGELNKIVTTEKLLEIFKNK